MVRFIVYAGIVVSGLSTSVYAGPACAAKHWKTENCISACKQRFGWPGMGMGSDRWGSVMKPSESSVSMDDVVSNACGMASSSKAPSPQPTVAKAAGAAPSSVIIPSSSSVVTNITTSSAAPSSSAVHVSSVKLQVSKSSSVAQTTRTAPRTTSTKPPPPPTTHVQEPTTTSKPPPPPPTTTRSQPKNTPDSSNSDGNKSSNSGGNSNSGSSGGSTSSSDINAYLSSHNSVRSAHGASALTWNEGLAGKAAQWANGCAFHHSGGTLGPLGENLAAGTGSFSIQTGIKLWADEAPEYNPSSPNPSHFTQMVWKASKEVGCAKVSCAHLADANFNNAVYIVCEYSPAGNVIGEFGQNVQA